MNKWGYTPAGTPRWFCHCCSISRTRIRLDNAKHTRLRLFVSWLVSKKTLQEIAKKSGVSIQTILTWFQPFWQCPPLPKYMHPVRVLVLDATSVQSRKNMLLIGGDNDRLMPVSWTPVIRECYMSWLVFLQQLSFQSIQPSVVVCDGQRGLLKAIHTIWPQTSIQRCLIHVVRQARSWLTQHPKTRAGQELLVIVQCLSKVRTRRQKRRWIRWFKYWLKKHQKFLKERSYTINGRWWYTHRKLRGVKTLLLNAIPDLFRFVSDPTIPRTSNHVEGGINARLKELFRCHRGFSVSKKLALASWYLAMRQGQKTTRNFN